MVQELSSKGNIARLCTAAIACSGIWAFGSAAQTYPVKSIRAIVAYPPGGGSDQFARPIAAKLSERLGRQVVVDNRGGAAGVIGSEAAARAPADGYTIFMDNVTSHALYPPLVPNLPFNTLRDFAPIALAAFSPNAVIVHPSVPVRTVKELIALAKAKPGQLSYSHAGTAGPAHLTGEMFNMRAGTNILNIPYKGGGPAIMDLIAGHVPVTWSTLPTAFTHVKAARVRALAVTSAQRVSPAPDIPTVAESGLPGFEANNWYGVMAPAGVPREIIARLHAEMVVVMKSPDIVERFNNLGFETMASTPQEMYDNIRTETEKWTKVIRDAGIKLE